jgi:hypothetical protein
MDRERFDKLYPPTYSVSFTYRAEDGRVIHGGHWDYRVSTQQEALETFYRDYAERRPDYVAERLEVVAHDRDFDVDDLLAYIELLERERRA